VLPTAAGASRIARMITNPSAESLLRDGAGMAQLDEQLRHIGLQFVEIPIPADSTLVNKMIDDIDRAIWQRSSLSQSGRPPAKSVATDSEQACSHRTTRSSLSAGRRGDLPKSLHTATKAGMTYRGCKT
jgi:hypothetical protein